MEMVMMMMIMVMMVLAEYMVVLQALERDVLIHYMTVGLTEHSLVAPKPDLKAAMKLLRLVDYLVESKMESNRRLLYRRFIDR